MRHSSRWRWVAPWGWVVGVAAAAILIGALRTPDAVPADRGPAPPAAVDDSSSTSVRETFALTYTVTIDAASPRRAHVRWDLAGIDEIVRLRFTIDPERVDQITASGTLERREREVVWTPGAPYAHLAYRVRLRHRRATDRGFDSYADREWVLTRTRDLFPRVVVTLEREIEPEPEARARLVFRLPPGWDAVTAMSPDGERRFVVEGPERFDHPRGWLMLGRFARTEATIDGTTVTIASAPGVAMPARRVLRLLEDVLPVMTPLLGRTPPRLLIVLGADPMWRGGLSGENSLYMHGDRPLRTPDRTSPYLHELFHVLAPFRPAPDGHWVTEGLAEFYSLELQRRIGRLDEKQYNRALRLFARYGAWRRDLTRAHDLAARNNSAPLVMWALDRRIRAVTDGKRDLDAVVQELAREGGRVTTARFLGAVRRQAGQGFGAFFRRHVYRGEPPSLDGLPG